MDQEAPEELKQTQSQTKSLISAVLTPHTLLFCCSVATDFFTHNLSSLHIFYRSHCSSLLCSFIIIACSCFSFYKQGVGGSILELVLLQNWYTHTHIMTQLIQASRFLNRSTRIYFEWKAQLIGSEYQIEPLYCCEKAWLRGCFDFRMNLLSETIINESVNTTSYCMLQRPNRLCESGCCKTLESDLQQNYHWIVVTVFLEQADWIVKFHFLLW